MKDDLAYIEHIQQSINKIFEYTNNISKTEFSEKPIIQDAVLRNIEIIGEATKNISQEFRASYPEIPWKSMAGMRDKLIHNYMGVDIDVIWRTVEKDVPEINRLLQQIDFSE